ncbi:hypothetical protein [Microbispora hainanensis]|uniref:hypothetical protein n=1 Tax=Microbispora hainanensis TaxID=568844 RepID=UPI00142EFDFD|nr:hypothetical protein [Microbispora hainanensis]
MTTPAARPGEAVYGVPGLRGRGRILRDHQSSLPDSALRMRGLRMRGLRLRRLRFT